MHTLKSPASDVVDLASGYVVARAVQAAGHFRIADHLSRGPKSAWDLAQLTGTDVHKLTRLMRALVGVGIFLEGADGRYALTARGDALRSDAPEGAHAAVLLLSTPNMWDAFGSLPALLQAAPPARGLRRPFADAAASPDLAPRLSEGMMGFSFQEAAAIAEAYDWSSCRVIMDVGGNNGHLLTTILGTRPDLRGVVFDQSHATTAARRLIAKRELTDRCTVVTGDFFEAVPDGADVCIVSNVLHDWPDDDYVSALRNIRQALPPDGRLLVAEVVPPDRSVAHQGRAYDLMLLACTGGRERTRNEHTELLGQAGFRLIRIVPTRLHVGIIEAVPV